jgi:Stigma-specific protein, Stig1
MTEETRGRSLDELAKGLANGEVSRGKALRLIGAALVGGTLASIPGMVWAARTPPPGKGGCPQGKTLCRGKCYDLQSDRANCGQCGNVCSESQTCEGGTCKAQLGGACSSATPCRSGLTCSNGTCVTICSEGQAGCGQQLCACPQGTHCLGGTAAGALCVADCPVNTPNSGCASAACACPSGTMCVDDQCV